MCRPLFDFRAPIETIGDGVPVPHGFFKSVLAERSSGRIEVWTFVLKNIGETDKSLADRIVATTDVELWAGLPLWDRLKGEEGEEIDAIKREPTQRATPKMWE